MAAQSFYFPIPGTPTGEGYSLSFCAAGTSTPQAVYHDSDLGSEWAQPIVFNADGQPDGPIFLSPTPALKILYTDENDVDVPNYPYDDYAPLAVAS